QQDIDVLLIVPSNEEFDLPEFTKSPYIDNLYQATMGGFDVDCKVVYNMGIAENTISRDFTFRSLFCDSEGNVFDPTGRGLEDFKNKRLCTIKHPAICLEEGPERVFLAL